MHFAQSLNSECVGWKMMHHCDWNDWINRRFTHRQKQTIRNKGLEWLASLSCTPYQIETTVSTNHLNFWIYTKILSITTSNISNYWTILLTIYEVSYFWPWLIPCIAEMGSYLFIYLVNMLFLHICRSFFIQIFSIDFSFFTVSCKKVFWYSNG